MDCTEIAVQRDNCFNFCYLARIYTNAPSRCFRAVLSLNDVRIPHLDQKVW